MAIKNWLLIEPVFYPDNSTIPLCSGTSLTTWKGHGDSRSCPLYDYFENNITEYQIGNLV